MSLFIKKKYTSFNDFFMREKIKINVDHNSQAFISPCDSYYSKYHITKNLEVTIKHVNYSLADLLRSKTLAKEYENGQMLIFRLTPRDYHHYHYIDDGIKLSSKKISGVFHTVRPVALVKKVVFIENNREYSVLETKNFGKIIYMEVGALGVGKIIDQEKKSFQKGEEKGCFAFGGSTVILILPANKIKWKYDKYFEKEKYVLCGERI